MVTVSLAGLSPVLAFRPVSYQSCGCAGRVNALHIEVDVGSEGLCVTLLKGVITLSHSAVELIFEPSTKPNQRDASKHHTRLSG
jgi:hypothetical protein